MKARQQNEARSSQVQAAISVGASILGAFLGRKTISAANIGRATTAVRSAGRVMKESKDIGQAEENVAALQQQLADLEAQFKSESDTLAAATDPLSEQLESIAIKPAKANIAVKLVALAWTPYWKETEVRSHRLGNRQETATPTLLRGRLILITWVAGWLPCNDLEIAEAFMLNEFFRNHSRGCFQGGCKSLVLAP